MIRDKFEKYLETLKVSDIITKRLDEIYEQILVISKGFDIKDMFLSESRETETEGKYQAVWFFNESGVFNARLLEDQIETIANRNSIFNIVFTKQNYDLKKSTKDSKLVIEVFFKDRFNSWILIASENNCEFLLNIYEKYLLPNIMSVPKNQES